MNKSAICKALDIRGNVLTITTTDGKLVVVTDKVLTNTKKKILTQDILSNIMEGTEFSVEGLLTTHNIKYKALLSLDEAEILNTIQQDVNYKLRLNFDKPLVCRQQASVKSLKDLIVTDTYLYLGYEFSNELYYIDLLTDTSKYSDTYKEGVMDTMVKVINDVVKEHTKPKKSLLIDKMFTELESMLPVRFLNVMTI